MSGEKRRIGFFKGQRVRFKAKWKLENRIATLEFELERLRKTLEDADNRLEAYKDVLAAMTRHHQLAGLLTQIDIDDISKKIERSKG